MSSIKQYKLEELSLGMKVNPLSLQDIYGTVIVLGDFDDEGAGIIKYIGEPDTKEVVDICLAINPRCVVYTTEVEEYVHYDI